MHAATYYFKRDELARTYPVYLSNKWLRNTRIIVSIFFMVVLKITQSSLPSYDIRNIRDTFSESFLEVQDFVYSPTLMTACQWLLFLITLANVSFTVGHWVAFSDKLHFPLAVLIFYFVKLLSDSALRLTPSKTMRWENFALFGYSVLPEQIFYSNVCPYTAWAIFSFLYAFQVNNIAAKTVVLSFIGVSLLIVVLILLLFSLTHSIALFAGLIAVFFSLTMANDIINFISPKKKALPLNASSAAQMNESGMFSLRTLIRS